MKFYCCVCGYDGLEDEPYNEDGFPSFEICSCCGFEFGVTDMDEGYTFKVYREKWLLEGYQWFFKKDEPVNWSLEEQLLNLKEL